MEIVIKIPEETYDFVQNTSFVEDENTLSKQSNADRQKTLFLFDIIDAIRNGTPLPEHHGRLIDADAIPRHLVRDIDEIDKQPTIIEGSDSE